MKRTRRQIKDEERLGKKHGQSLYERKRPNASVKISIEKGQRANMKEIRNKRRSEK